MTKKKIINALERHGFFSSRMITHSKRRYCQRHPNNFTVFNAKVFTRHALILHGTDLDLTRDARELTAAAREAGENFYVLCEHHPHPFWEPDSIPMRQVLRSAIWWTRIRPQDHDAFVPVESASQRPNRLRLNCVTGEWQGGPAYSISCWENEEFYNTNMVGAALEIAGHPPKKFRVKKAETGAGLSKPPSATRGQPVRPVFYQHSGVLEYVWFDNGAAVPAVLYDNVLRPLEGVNFTVHREHEAIHIRRSGRMIGLIWPCGIGAPEVIANARRQLGLADDIKSPSIPNTEQSPESPEIAEGPEDAQEQAMDLFRRWINGRRSR